MPAVTLPARTRGYSRAALAAAAQVPGPGSTTGRSCSRTAIRGGGSTPCASRRSSSARAWARSSSRTGACGDSGFRGRRSTGWSTSSSSPPRTAAARSSATPRTRCARRARSATARSSSCPDTARPTGSTTSAPAGRVRTLELPVPPAPHRDHRPDLDGCGRGRPRRRCRSSSSTTGPSTPTTPRSCSSSTTRSTSGRGAAVPRRAASAACPSATRRYSASARLQPRARRATCCRSCGATCRRPGGRWASGRASARSRSCTRTARTRVFGGLFLQSGSFFRQRFDQHESRFRALRPHRALRRARARAGAWDDTDPRHG